MKRGRRIAETLIANLLLIGSTVPATAHYLVPSSTHGTGDAKGLSSAQSNPNGTLAPPMTRRSAGRYTAGAQRTLTENELLNGVNLTDDQKAAIDRIHRTMRTKMEIVAKDDNETPEQKSAMLEGLNRMQLRQVFEVLTPEQREDVRKRIVAMRSANRQDGQVPSHPQTH
jgi:Spy/CpxP family protein refolding chaperone